MDLLTHLRQRHWPTVFGYGLFTGMMAVGYLYNLTFVQLGLVDLGRRLVGLSERAVALNMAALALLTCLVALSFGWLMSRRGWSDQFVCKLRMAFAVVVAQTLLTTLAPAIRSAPFFTAWIAACSLTLGIGVPATFSLTVDLVPVRDRGLVAAVITAAAYFAAAVCSSVWEIERFAVLMLTIMAPGGLLLGLLAFKKWDWVEQLAWQHTCPQFRVGRFLRGDTLGRHHLPRRTLIFISLMAAIYFIDSLGFLRLIDTPIYMQTTWRSPALSPHLTLGSMHILGALIGGILYTGLDEKTVFAWIFGLFALVHLMYVMHTRLTPESSAVLTMSLLYTLAVSLYTVVNFAAWADLSTPETVSLRTALGVALSGWTATFLSTALALEWRLVGLSLDEHLSRVAALALAGFLATLALSYWQGGQRRGTSHET